MLVVPAALLVVGRVVARGRTFAGARSAGARARAIAAFGLGLSVPLAAIAIYDYARFGSVFQTGYAAEVAQWTTPFFEGVTGLLVSPGRGLLWFAPIAVASVAFAPRFARRFPMEAAFSLAALATLVCTYASWYMWEGGWCWGPRFLVPAMPLLLLPVGAWLSETPRHPGARAGFALLAVVSLVVSWSGLFVNPIDFHNWVKLYHEFRAEEFAAVGVSSYYDLVRWDWRFSPLVASWSFPVKDAFLLPHALRLPGVVLGLHAGFACGLVFASWRLRGALRGAIPQSEISGSEALAAP